MDNQDTRKLATDGIAQQQPRKTVRSGRFVQERFTSRIESCPAPLLPEDAVRPDRENNALLHR
jgi:hypothetical protein